MLQVENVLFRNRTEVGCEPRYRFYNKEKYPHLSVNNSIGTDEVLVKGEIIAKKLISIEEKEFSFLVEMTGEDTSEQIVTVDVDFAKGLVDYLFKNEEKLEGLKLFTYKEKLYPKVRETYKGLDINKLYESNEGILLEYTGKTHLEDGKHQAVFKKITGNEEVVYPMDDLVSEIMELFV